MDDIATTGEAVSGPGGHRQVLLPADCELAARYEKIPGRFKQVILYSTTRSSFSGSESSVGNTHDVRDMPVLAFGGKFLELHGGSYLQFGNSARAWQLLGPNRPSLGLQRA